MYAIRSYYGISEKAAAKMIMGAREMCDLGFKSGVELLNQRKSVWRLSTGSKELDDVLAGGLESQSVTEFAGMYGSGKTQIMHQSCVNLQIASKIFAETENVLEKELPRPKAVYIDTEGTFRPERIVITSYSIHYTKLYECRAWELSMPMR